MVEPDPVSDLVSRGTSQVVVDHGTSREGRVENHDTVVHGVGLVVGREGSVTEKTLAFAGSETDGVEVERVGATLSESGLHAGLLGGIRSGAVEPVGIQGPGSVGQFESKTSVAVVLIQNIDLTLNLGIAGIDDR